MDVLAQRQNAFTSPSFIAETPPRRLAFCGFLSLPPSPPTQGPSSSPFSHRATFCSSSPKRRASVPAMILSTASPILHVPGIAQEDRVSLHATPTITITERRTSTSGPRPRPLFHIPYEVSSDDGYSPGGSQDRSSKGDPSSPEGSTNGHIQEVGLNWETSKDDIRRYHALMELLTTEVGYLMDLRALVTIYLRQLPTLTSRASISGSSSAMSFGRIQSSSGIPGTSRVNSHPYVHLNTPVDGAPQVQGAGSERSSPRYLFSDTEIETLTRNAEEILQLHEHFVEELQAAVSPFGFTMTVSTSGISGDMHNQQKQGIDSAGENVGAAIGAVATVFVTKASRFNSYESFCSGHPEALDLVRKVRQQYVTEWDAFEQRASSLAADMLELPGGDRQLPAQMFSSEEHAPNTLSVQQHAGHRQRTYSVSSMEGRRSLRAQLVMSTVSKTCVPQDAGLKARVKGLRRLSLMDYMIKPVQRICKYPLLLGQLSTGPHTSSPDAYPSNVNITVESALQAMRQVASSVDEARRRQGIATQSAIIITRISLALAHSHSSAFPPAYQSLTPTFLASVGACLLAGSLDVVHYPASSATVKVKYLGAFLYMGGYFVLVKVCKGKIYEPIHWFSLVGFEVVDVEEKDAMLPCSFRLSCRGHCFELAAACQREKETWIASIRESLSLPPTWTHEPASSLQFDGKGELVPSSLDGPFDAITSLPTIQSIPELDNTPEVDEPSLTTLDTTPAGTISWHGITPKTDLPLPPSRRSSTASVKAIFLPAANESDTILIRRSTATTRARVDNGLQDVISSPCLSARSYASTHEEELFQAPKIIRSGFSRSSSGLSMANAMGVAAKNRLSRHESLRVPRRKSTLDGCRPSGDLDALAAAFAGAVQDASSRARSLASRRQTRRLKIIPGPRSDMKRGLSIPSSDILPDSPTSQSLCSSATRSSPSSAAVSPIADTVLLPASPKGTTQQSGLLHMAQAEYRPKRSRSLASNVKSLFQTGSLPPLEFGRQDPDERKHPNRSSTTVTPGLFRRWIGPNHRRVRSVPDHLKTPIPNTGLSEYRLQMNLGSKSTLSVHVPIAASEPFDPDFGQGLSYVHSISSAVVHTPNG